MKKIILLLLITFSLFSDLSAQGLHFGLKLGADMHKISGTSFQDKYNVGYHAGVFAEINLPGKIGIQPEAYYSQVNPKVATGTSGIYGFNNVTKIKLSYLNFPILLNFKVAPMLSFQAGPQFGVLINKDKSISQNGKDAFKSGDVGIAAGLQVNVTKVKIYARYVAGLNDLNNTNTGKRRNQAIHLGLGLRLF